MAARPAAVNDAVENGALVFQLKEGASQPKSLTFQGHDFQHHNDLKRERQFYCSYRRRKGFKCTSKLYIPKDGESDPIRLVGLHARSCVVLNGKCPEECDWIGKYETLAYDEENADPNAPISAREADEELRASHLQQELADRIAAGDLTNNLPPELADAAAAQLVPQKKKVRDAKIVDASEEMRQAAQNYATKEMDLTPDMIWTKVSEDMRAKYPDGHTGRKKSYVISLVKRARGGLNCGDAIRSAEHPTLALMKDGSKRPFLQYNMAIPHPTKAEKMCRVMAWANPEILPLLRGKPDLFIDATFDCAPAPFYQCLIIMVFDHQTGVYVPVCYILMSHKLEELYWHAFHVVVVASKWKMEPRSITYDFERAIINAARTQFPGHIENGCDFHLKQAWRRKMVDLKIDEDQIAVAMRRGVLDLLSVIPHDEIETKGIQYVRTIIEVDLSADDEKKWDSFWYPYFTKTWLDESILKVWSHWDPEDPSTFKFKEIVNRTNNALEKYNRRFNKLFPTHPSLAHFIQAIEKESRYYAQKLQDIRTGQEQPPTYRPTRA